MNTPLKPLMIAGTGSDVGKSIIAAALCRIFLRDGFTPAPFKAQNMSLNSYATPDGREIARSQAVQAEAAGIPCSTDMNPLLLKPSGDHTSQVILHGRPLGVRHAFDLFRRRHDPAPTSPAPPVDFEAEVHSAFDRLRAAYNPIVIEGAGSIAEINLRQSDLVNMSMARHARASVILVADIDRGGVFASVYGTIALQTPEDRPLIKGIIINKFRGDMRLFDEGRKLMERICRVPVLGVVPFLPDLHIEEEDSVPLSRKPATLRRGPVSVAVVMLRHISNYTDFDALEHDTRVNLIYTSDPADISGADIIILPGTKATLDDLFELRLSGCAQAILNARRRGATVLGICGGYQMMGLEVADPQHVEGDRERLPGLALLPVTTTISGQKTTRQVECQYGQGYEIHMGETRPALGAPPSPLLHLSDGRDDGYIADAKCMGTYVHGILDNTSFRDFLLQPYHEKTGPTASFDYQAFKQQQFDLLADHVRRHVDMARIYEIMKI